MKVIDTEFFKKDYEDSTLKLLSKPIDYDEAIESLEKIIESGVFELDEEMGSKKKKDMEMWYLNICFSEKVGRGKKFNKYFMDFIRYTK